jgi:hypothetical protein
MSLSGLWPWEKNAERDRDELFALSQRNPKADDFDRALERFLKSHGGEAGGVLAEWVQGADEARAEFAMLALKRGRGKEGLPLLETMLWSDNLPDLRRLTLSTLVKDLGGDVDEDRLLDLLEKPDSIGATLFQNALDRSGDPAAVNVFLEAFGKVYPDMRSQAVTDSMGPFAGDPRLAAIVGPLLLVHHRLIGTALARLLAASAGPLARRWAWEFARLFPGEAGLVAMASPAPDVPPGRTFHRAHLSTPDALGSRVLLFATMGADGLSFANVLLNDQIGVKETLAMTGSERAFERLVSQWRDTEGVALAEVGPATALRVLSEAESLTVAKNRSFPAGHLAWKPIFFVPDQGGAPWETAFPADIPDETPLSATEAEKLYGHPVFDDWDVEDKAWETEIAHALKKARRKAGKGSRPTEWGAALPEFLPDDLVRLWSGRLKEAAFIFFGRGERDTARLALRCGLTLRPGVKTSHPFLKLLCLKAAVALSQKEPVPIEPVRDKASPNRPFHRLSGWAVEHPLAGPELADLMAENLTGGATVPLESGANSAYNLLTDYFLFDRPSPGLGGKRPWDAFLETVKMSGEEKSLYASWRDCRFSLYKVLDRAPGVGVTVAELSGGGPIVVREKMGSLALKPGMVLGARIMPHERVNVFSPGIVALPEEAGYILERGRRSLHHGGKVDPLEFAQWLAKPWTPQATR